MAMIGDPVCNREGHMRRIGPRGESSMSRVLLVNMPFSSLRWPALGIRLLQAALNRDGIDCDLAYLQLRPGRDHWPGSLRLDQ